MRPWLVAGSSTAIYDIRVILRHMHEVQVVLCITYHSTNSRPVCYVKDWSCSRLKVGLPVGTGASAGFQLPSRETSRQVSTKTFSTSWALLGNFERLWMWNYLCAVIGAIGDCVQTNSHLSKNVNILIVSSESWEHLNYLPLIHSTLSSWINQPTWSWKAIRPCGPVHIAYPGHKFPGERVQ